MSHSAPGGRRATSRLNLTTILALALPLACAVALFLVRPADEPVATAAPTLTALTRSGVVCPSGTDGARCSKRTSPIVRASTWRRCCACNASWHSEAVSRPPSGRAPTHWLGATW